MKKNKKAKKNKPSRKPAKKLAKVKAKQPKRSVGNKSYKAKATTVKKLKKQKKFVTPKIRTKKKNKSSLAMRAAKTVPKKSGVVLKKADRQEQGMARLLHKGKERGYVTYDEILKEFPTIEEDILFLEELYEKLSSGGVDVLEGGGLLETPTEDVASKKYAYGRNTEGSYDSIQMYLKEIGQYQLISGSMEKRSDGGDAGIF